MDLSFIEPAFKSAFGNVSVTKTETNFIFKSTLAEDSYFSLKLSLDLSKIERVYGTKDTVYKFRAFFDNCLRKTDSKESFGSILVRIVQNLSKVSEWGCSKDETKLPLNRLEFVAGEFGRLEVLHGRKNYLIIEGNEALRHYPEGCGLVLQMKQDADTISTRAMAKDFEQRFVGETPKLLKIIGWWFHNQGESLEDWIKAPTKVYGLEILEADISAYPTSLEEDLKKKVDQYHRSRFAMIRKDISPGHSSFTVDMIEREIMDKSGWAREIRSPVINTEVVNIMTRYGYRVETKQNVGVGAFGYYTVISW